MSCKTADYGFQLTSVLPVIQCGKLKRDICPLKSVPGSSSDEAVYHVISKNILKIKVVKKKEFLFEQQYLKNESLAFTGIYIYELCVQADVLP